MKSTHSVAIPRQEFLKPKPSRKKTEIVVFRHTSIEGFVEKVKDVTVYYTLAKIEEIQRNGSVILFSAFNKQNEYHSFIVPALIQQADVVSLVNKTMQLEEVNSILVWIDIFKAHDIKLMRGQVENIYNYYKY